jgi:hypothetical protein
MEEDSFAIFPKDKVNRSVAQTASSVEKNYVLFDDGPLGTRGQSAGLIRTVDLTTRLKVIQSIP